MSWPSNRCFLPNKMTKPAMLPKTDDVRIARIQELIPPVAALVAQPITETAAGVTYDTRRAIANMLHGKDDRLLVVIGPCSIHDVDAAYEYARRLSAVRAHLQDDLLIVMRVYFEKPRTTVGWKGLINDPHLNDSFDINTGVMMARRLLLRLNDELEMPAATEFLDMITPQYIADLISWGAIGARTTESQAHRQLSSGLSCPVGFKNGTDGNLTIAIDAIRAAGSAHSFLSVTKYGHAAIVSTNGNPDCHVILRGGSQKTNFDAQSVDAAAKSLEKVGLEPRIMVDFSHANSSKQFKRQMEVGRNVSAQLMEGENRIFGVMVESHLVEGRQDLCPGVPPVYGQSITDACLGWEDSVALLEELAAAVRARRERRA